MIQPRFFLRSLQQARRTGKAFVLTRIGGVQIHGKAVLAPLAGITDVSFRLLARQLGAAAVFTEMISADGLTRGNNKTHRYLIFEEAERPVGFQIFGSDPAVMAQAARIVAQRKPDLVDINFGCPVKKVVKRNAGSALLREPELVGEIVRAVAESVPMPVVAKIRSGWDAASINAVSVAQRIEQAGAAAITVHPRTQAMGFRGRADWDVIRQVREAVRIPVIGNGDVACAADAKRMLDETGCDLVMVGRAAFGYPWIFRDIETFLATGVESPPPDVEEHISLCIQHLRMVVGEKGELVGVRQMRKHVAAYTKRMKGGAALRKAAFRLERAHELERLLLEFAQQTQIVSGVPSSYRQPDLAEWERATG